MSLSTSAMATVGSEGVSYSAGAVVSTPRLPAAPTGPTAVREESLLDFARWMATQLKLPVRFGGANLEIHLPEEDRELFGGRTSLGVSLVRGRLVATPAAAPDTSARPQQVEPLVWLLERFARLGMAHTRPVDQPVAVHAITQKLYDAYRVDGGQVHLAGCQLEDRPFLRLTYAGGASTPGIVRHLFVSPDGSSVPDELVAQLGLDRVGAALDVQPRIRREQLQALVAAGERMAAQRLESRNPSASAGKPLASAVVWTKYARVRLQFSIGDAAVKLALQGWAGSLVAPPWQCPHTGAQTYHLTAVDDGRIVAAEQVATCARTGQRVLASEVVTCAATGRQLLPEFTTKCPVLAVPVESDHFDHCATCGELVSTPALERGVCAACRQLMPLVSSDPRRIWLFGQYPTLGKWKWLRLAETETCYIVRGANLVQRILVVFDRETLVIRRVAKGHRGSKNWTPVPPQASSLAG